MIFQFAMLVYQRVKILNHLFFNGASQVVTPQIDSPKQPTLTASPTGGTP